MKQIIVKTKLMRLIAVALLSLVTLTSYGQYYMDIHQRNGGVYRYVIADIDSVIITDRNQNTDDNPAVVTDSLSESGLYMGVMCFNSQLSSEPISLLNSITKNKFDNFIDGVQMADGTILCYSVDKAIEALHAVALPKDLKKVAIVTFTDGLDQGSLPKIGYRYKSADEYLAAVNNKIMTEKVAGLPITAYSVGLRGSDVTDISKFQSTLKQLAYSDSLAFEVQNMTEVKEKFKEIAGQLNNSYNFQTIPIRIPAIDIGTRIRFTFDVEKNGDASKSELYIEGTFNVEFDPLRFTLTDVKYGGMTSESGTIVAGVPDPEDNVFVIFNFEKVLKKDNTPLSKDNVREWYLKTDQTW